MAKKHSSLGLAALVAAGAGAAALAAKNRQEKTVEKAEVKKATSDYRNTERGMNQKNSKGIYYSNGNYEAFARPEKPEGVDDKHAYLVGSGLAALAAACFMVRDAQMPGSHIHILEAMDVPGGACDGIFDPARGYVMRGGREMENHFECLWDLFRSIPSLEKPGASVLDEYYWLNKHDPNYSLCRATVDRGKDAHTDGKFNLSQKGCMEIMKLFFTKDEDLYDKTIEDPLNFFRKLQELLDIVICFLSADAFPHLAEKNADEINRRQLSAVGLGRCHGNIRSGPGVKDAVRLSRNRASHHIYDAKHRKAPLF